MKALIFGIWGQHEVDIRESFVLGYNNSGGNITTTDVTILETIDIEAAFNEAVTQEIDVIIYSSTGLTAALNIAKQYYPTVTLFMPAGANNAGEVYSGDIPQEICITGAGDEGNETADNVEFISNDPITAETEPDEQDLSSFSNGYIAGQIKYVADMLGCSIWEARYRAIITGSENGIWHEQNGFGFINTSAAIAWSGIIAVAPFLRNVFDVGVDNIEVDKINTESIISIGNWLGYDFLFNKITIDMNTYNNNLNF